MQKYSFNPDGTITNAHGISYGDSEALFDHIERLVYSLGGDVKWESGAMHVFHKDFYKVNQARSKDKTHFILLKYKKSGEGELECDIDLRFGKDVDRGIRTIEDLEKTIKEMVTLQLDDEAYSKIDEMPMVVHS